MSYQYDYNAEATGHVDRHGTNRGTRPAMWTATTTPPLAGNVRSMRSGHPLVDRLTAERDEAIRARDELLEQVRHAGQQTRKWHNAFYSVLCALDSAMDVLQHATAGHAHSDDPRLRQTPST